MRFYRIDPDDLGETYWLCENCISEHDIDGDVIDSSNDSFGDHTCGFCGLSFDHENMSYDTPK